jgi:cytochrome c oxidase subunit 3
MERPFQIVLWLLLAGLSALFLGLIGAYYYSVIQYDQPPIELPVIFLFNTAVLIFTSIWFERVRKQFDQQDFNAYLSGLYIILFATILFMICQVIGWYQMLNNALPPSSSQTSAYLYLLSGLHLVHIVFGLPFLIWYLVRMRKYIQEPHRKGIHMADPDNYWNLKYLSRYWHFLDGIWILLVIAFFLQQMVV